MSPFTRLVCWAVAALAAASATAQVHPNIERGLPANKAFEVGELDSINLFNGNLVVTIPIGQEYRLSSSLAYRLTLVYNSNVWDFEKRVDTSIPDPYTYTQAMPNRRANAGMGWALSLGRLYAPNTPTNDHTKWLYVGPDGAEHLFYPTLHEGYGETAGYSYTRDNTYLRMREISSTERRVEYPDGTVHQFKLSGSEWRIEKIYDRFTDALSQPVNYVSITYPANAIQLTDSLGRTHTISFRTQTPGIGQIGSVVLAGFGALTATYTLSYIDVSSLPVSCRDDDPTTPDAIAVSLLSSVALPDASAYQMFTYNQTNATNCDPPNLPGTLTSLRLPTGGRILAVGGQHLRLRRGHRERRHRP